MIITTIKRLVRKSGGYMIRRLGLLPGAIPDGIGDDKRLLGKTLPHTVMVFFPDSPEDLYQLEQWYGPLRALNKRHRTVIVMQDSRSAKRARAESGLDVIVVARLATLDDLISRSNLTVALYVNQHQENFSSLRFEKLVHASLMHGDSDKVVMVTHQMNAYDFCLVAGQAAIDRMTSYLPFYDAGRRCIPIGRPQLDDDDRRVTGPRARDDGDPPTVLYAPTWEGAQLAASYGSLDTHGETMVRALMADGWRVIYRPHPLTGVSRAEYADADARIRALVAEHGAPHRVDTGVPVRRSFEDADVLVCDVSAMAIDFLVMDRPLIMTVPAHPQATVATTRLTAMVPRVRAEEAARVPAMAAEQVAHDPLRGDRREMTTYYLGDVRPGKPTEQFLAGIERLIDERAQEWERLTST